MMNISSAAISSDHILNSVDTIDSCSGITLFQQYLTVFWLDSCSGSAVISQKANQSNNLRNSQRWRPTKEYMAVVWSLTSFSDNFLLRSRVEYLLTQSLNYSLHFWTVESGTEEQKQPILEISRNKRITAVLYFTREVSRLVSNKLLLF